ncbi:MAG: hypothetical protein JW757_06365, partial [Anaerolineales bacterium]|nr:hypothetical protein [Anaerolineales bacterium]
PAIFPFSEPGPFWSGRREYRFVDNNRGGREISVTIWYPALKQTDDQGKEISLNAIPDMSNAPYPMIMTGPASGRYIFNSHLTSYGFVTAIVHLPDYYDYPDFQSVDHPLDFLFILDQIASVPLEGLEGVIDADQVGVTGFSGDGFISLALSGVRIDPANYLSFCENPYSIEPEPSDWYINFWCRSLASKWGEFASHVGEKITDSDDGLWQPLTDNRIRAVMPMAADGRQLFGARGLATVDRPMLLIAATDDQYVPYEIETTYIFEYIGGSKPNLISFIGETHDMPFHAKSLNGMKHYAVAFFGYHLQDREDFQYYYSKDFVSKIDDLAWGVYP